MAGSSKKKTSTASNETKTMTKKKTARSKSSNEARHIFAGFLLGLSVGVLLLGMYLLIACCM